MSLVTLSSSVVPNHHFSYQFRSQSTEYSLPAHDTWDNIRFLIEFIHGLHPQLVFTDLNESVMELSMEKPLQSILKQCRNKSTKGKRQSCYACIQGYVQDTNLYINNIITTNNNSKDTPNSIPATSTASTSSLPLPLSLTSLRPLQDDEWIYEGTRIIVARQPLPEGTVPYLPFKFRHNTNLPQQLQPITITTTTTTTDASLTSTIQSKSSNAPATVISQPNISNNDNRATQSLEGKNTLLSTTPESTSDSWNTLSEMERLQVVTSSSAPSACFHVINTNNHQQYPISQQQTPTYHQTISQYDTTQRHNNNNMMHTANAHGLTIERRRELSSSNEAPNKYYSNSVSNGCTNDYRATHPPTRYICHYCGVVGEHFITYCPQRNNPQFRPLFKRVVPAGIPRQRFRPAQPNEMDLAYITREGNYVVLRTMDEEKNIESYPPKILSQQSQRNDHHQQTTRHQQLSKKRKRDTSMHDNNNRSTSIHTSRSKKVSF